MNPIKVILPATAIIVANISLQAQAPQLRADNIDEVVKAMTLEEKADICVGTGMAGVSSGPVIGSTKELVPGAAGIIKAIPRLGIPGAVLTDGPAGVRIDPTREFDSKTYYCTHFPIGICLASSWNTELVESVGNAMGNEVLEYGCDVLLAPAMNIHRNPLCGRNFEYYSEDPVLAGKIAAAYIRGIQSQGVGTSPKHFAFNSQETQRMGNNAIVDQRAAREIYLKGFEIAIKEGKPWTVMSSYNLINGVMTSENKELLTTILRDEWGFDGLVMTDWFGGLDPVRRMHVDLDNTDPFAGFSAFLNSADRAANMWAGNDLIEPGAPRDVTAIIEAVKSGELSEEDLDRNVHRILELVVKSPRFKGYQYSNEPDLKAHAQVTRSSAAEGAVLLKNDGVLPLSGVKNVAVYGCTSYDLIPGGTGSGNVNRAYTVSLIEGLRNNGLTVDDNVLARYSAHLKQWKQKHAATATNVLNIPELPAEIIFSADELAASVAHNDVALITLGRICGEGADRPTSDFELSVNEQELIKSVSEAFQKAGKKAVVILNIGNTIESASWKDTPNAILLPWQGGQEAGNSIADLLCGRLTPSGKLPDTWPVSLSDIASTSNFPLDVKGDGAFSAGGTPDLKNVGYTDYAEGIYVGYRDFDTNNKEVSYPFGYGLSYTTFAYDGITATDKGDEVEVSVTIKNTGDLAGKEIAQVYVTAPKGSIDKPAQELKAFAKTALLQPGESQTLTMTIAKIDLASFNEKSSSWIADAGTYTFKVGASSRDIKGSAQLKLKKQTEPVNNVLKKAN